MDYAEPVAKLLNYGICNEIANWPDYLKLGFTQKHIPELIRMVTDQELLWADQNSLEVWAPVHAWRALAQLRAEEAINPLIGLFNELSDDDWASDELPVVIAWLGVKAIKPLREYLLDSSNQEFARATAASCLEEIGKKNSSFKIDCISILAEYLEQANIDVPTLNGLVIAHLIGLKAISSIKAIRKVFKNGNVDFSVAGDLEEVEIQLGLRKKRETPQPHYFYTELEEPSSIIDNRKVKKKKIGRNAPCPCGSGKKYKKCCLNKTFPA